MTNCKHMHKRLRGKFWYCQCGAWFSARGKRPGPRIVWVCEWRDRGGGANKRWGEEKSFTQLTAAINWCAKNAQEVEPIVAQQKIGAANRIQLYQTFLVSPCLAKARRCYQKAMRDDQAMLAMDFQYRVRNIETGEVIPVEALGL